MIRNNLGEMRAYMEAYFCCGKKILKHNQFKGELMWE